MYMLEIAQGGPEVKIYMKIGSQKVNVLSLFFTPSFL